MKKKQPEEQIDDDIEEVEEQEEDRDEDEDSEEQDSDDDSGEEGEEGEEEPDSLGSNCVEDYNAFLCQGYTPAQIDKFLPAMDAYCEKRRVDQLAAAHKNLVNSGLVAKEICQEVLDIIESQWAGDLKDAFSKMVAELREVVGPDPQKMWYVVAYYFGALKEMSTAQFQYAAESKTPKPENG